MPPTSADPSLISVGSDWLDFSCPASALRRNNNNNDNLLLLSHLFSKQDKIESSYGYSNYQEAILLSSSRRSDKHIQLSFLISLTSSCCPVARKMSSYIRSRGLSYTPQFNRKCIVFHLACQANHKSSSPKVETGRWKKEPSSCSLHTKQRCEISPGLCQPSEERMYRVRKAQIKEWQEELVLPYKSSSWAVGFRSGGQAQIGASQAGWISQVKAVIKDREQKLWRLEVEHKPKLRLYANLKTKLEPELYLGHENFGNRRLFTMLRCGTNSLRVETGRWKKEPLEKRICDTCLASQVEDEMHFLLACGVWCSSWTYVRWHLSNNWTQRCQTYEERQNFIGHGLKKFRQEILRAVMKYVAQANRIRKEYSGHREVE